MPQAIDLLTRLIEAQSPSELWDRYTDALLSYGFDRLVYGLSTYAPREIASNDQDVVFFSTPPVPKGSEASAMQFFMRTPMFRWVVENRGSCSWSWAENERLAGRLRPEELDAYYQRIAMGQMAGYVLSLRDPSPRGRGVLSLIARPGLSQEEIDAMWAQRGAEIEALSYMMHFKMQLMPMPVRRRKLSPRQREALEWVAAGKTTQDIAIIMGVTAAMVEKHLRRARETLDVETTAHAVAKAAILNHLFDDSSKITCD